MIYQVFLAEKSKSKKTFALWMTILGALLVPMVCFLICYFRWKHFLPQIEENAWIKYTSFNFSFSAGLLFPFLVILFVAFNLNLEYKADSWKKLYTIPIRKETLFWGRFLFLAFQLLSCILIFSFGLLVSGLILGLVRPELELFIQTFDLIWFVKLMASLFISMLGILTIQLILCIIFNNMILPITIGIMFIIISLVISYGWKYAMLEPYAFPILLSYSIDKRVVLPLLFGFRLTQILSILYFVVFSLIGMVYYKNKNIK